MPVIAKGQARCKQAGRTQHHLGSAHAKDGPAHAPQPAGLQLQADEEQHQHHAKFGKMQDVLHIAHQLQAAGPYEDAGHQVANDGAQPQRARYRYRDDGGCQVEEGVGKPGGSVFHACGLLWIFVVAEHRLLFFAVSRYFLAMFCGWRLWVLPR